MIAMLTDVFSAPRAFPLSPECAVMVLTRCIAAVSALAVRTSAEAAVWQETIDVLASLRLDIQRKILAEIEREKIFLGNYPEIEAAVPDYFQLTDPEGNIVRSTVKAAGQ